MSVASLDDPSYIIFTQKYMHLYIYIHPYALRTHMHMHIHTHTHTCAQTVLEHNM